MSRFTQRSSYVSDNMEMLIDVVDQHDQILVLLLAGAGGGEGAGLV